VIVVEVLIDRVVRIIVNNGTRAAICDSKPVILASEMVPLNRAGEGRIMENSGADRSKFHWLRPLLLAAVVTLLIGGCKSEMQGSTGGMPAPPGGGMPAPPSPPGGGSSGGGSSGGGSSGGGSSGGGSSGGGASGGGSSGGGSSGGGMPGGGMPGGGVPGGGDAGTSGSSGSGDSGDGSGEVGSFPGEDPLGVPPPPSQRGGGGSDGDMSGDGGSGGDTQADNTDSSDSGETGGGDCGDTGALPGGIGGMGEAGECLGGGASASETTDADAAAAGSGSGSGGADGTVAGTGGAGAVGEFPEESAAERAERLGKELDESIGGFDQVLMEEQQEIASVGRNTEGFGDGGGGGGGSGGGISLGQQAGGTSGGSVSVVNTGQARTSPIDGMSQEEIAQRTPDDVASMVDDDIIARQLREAALAEEDAVLRERLWEEYRKYKGL